MQTQILPATNDAVDHDHMTIFNCGFKFQNATYVNTIKQYEVWLDNLGQHAVGIGQYILL